VGPKLILQFQTECKADNTCRFSDLVWRCLLLKGFTKSGHQVPLLVSKQLKKTTTTTKKL